MYGAAKGPRRYSGAVGTIELDDFIQEFDTWCDMQFLRNPTLFTPFFAWKGLFQHLEGPPMDDYHEFGREYAAEIDAWRRHWSPNYSSITQGGVGTSGAASIGISGGASSSISEGTSGAVGATGTSTSSGTVSIAGGSTRGDASGVPSFSPIPEFFQRLRKNYQGVKTEKLRSLQEFERKTGESLREAYTRMRRLISVTHGVTEAQAVQYWYRILDRELRRRVRDATLMSDSSPTLAHVFALSEKIELNMVEERVVTSTFARDTTTTSRIPHSTAQSRPMGGGSGSRGAICRESSEVVNLDDPDMWVRVCSQRAMLFWRVMPVAFENLAIAQHRDALRSSSRLGVSFCTGRRMVLFGQLSFALACSILLCLPGDGFHLVLYLLWRFSPRKAYE
ncbi:hypothetical protein AXG93_2490s1200 [Marchantia polymorpha subsp. ruderalis]|uniref:Retrotransposon gag domain-containing protein n=1 Tax=Marchantia polymorpha subsp. ruderalis TaxID=1480154 RepID=A0A176W5M2_MARPO|nr:hypothetical protein AXG93_2490s1200 [Marchantia polymorpha subsp. ruderalis]